MLLLSRRGVRRLDEHRSWAPFFGAPVGPKPSGVVRTYVGSRGNERLQFSLEFRDYTAAVSATADARWGLDDLQFPPDLFDRVVQLLAERSIVFRHVVAFLARAACPNVRFPPISDLT